MYGQTNTGSWGGFGIGNLGILIPRRVLITNPQTLGDRRCEALTTQESTAETTKCNKDQGVGVTLADQEDCIVFSPYYISKMNSPTSDREYLQWEPCSGYTYQKALFDTGGYMTRAQVSVLCISKRLLSDH
jgi:hypothetical protein